MHRHILHVVEEVPQRHKVYETTCLEDHLHLHHVAYFFVHCATCIKQCIANAVTKYDFDTISCTLE